VLTPHRQSYLESTFPSHYAAPSKSAIRAASASNEEELDREETSHEILEYKLSIRNTIMKFILDQTISAAANTLSFSLALAGFRGASWGEAVRIAKQDFWGLMFAGWKLWPAVSVINYSFVRSVQGRAMVGSLAGMIWGVYLSLVSSRS